MGKNLKEDSGDKAAKDKVYSFTAKELKSIIERVERLEEEKKDLSSDIGEIFSEAKGKGYDVKTLRKGLARRKMDSDHRDTNDDLLLQYETALGMHPSLSDEESAA